MQPRDFGFGFPFDAGQLACGHPGWRYPNPFEKTERAQVSPLISRPQETTPMPDPVSPSRERIRWSRLAPTMVLVAIAIGALQLAMNSDHTSAASSPAAETGPAAPEPASQSVLGLTVASRSHQLEIRWNRESALITAADKAVRSSIVKIFTG